MSCTDFPSTGLIPNVTTHTVGNITYIWTGIAWESQVNVPAGELVNDLSQAYIFDTVADYQASTIVFPVGKTIHLNDRQADFTIIAGTGTANGYNIIASNSTGQSVDLDANGSVNVINLGADATGNLDSFEAIQATHLLANALLLPVSGVGVFKLLADSSIPVKTRCDYRGAKFILNDLINITDLFVIEPTIAKLVFTPPATNFNKGATIVTDLTPYPNACIAIDSADTYVLRNGVDVVRKRDIVYHSKDGNISNALFFNMSTINGVTVNYAEGYLLEFYAPDIEYTSCNINNFVRSDRNTVTVFGGKVTNNNTLQNVIPITTYFNPQVCMDNTLDGRTGDPLTPFNDDFGYDFSGGSVLNPTMRNVNTPYSWGSMDGNVYRNMLVENCIVSRVGCHALAIGVTINNTTLMEKGVQVTGGGTLKIENVTRTVSGSNGSLGFVSPIVDLREDYGGEWDGDIVVKDFTMHCGDSAASDAEICVVRQNFKGNINYGKDITMPKRVFIERGRIITSSNAASAAAIYVVDTFRYPETQTQITRTLPALISIKDVKIEVPTGSPVNQVLPYRHPNVLSGMTVGNTKIVVDNLDFGINTTVLPLSRVGRTLDIAIDSNDFGSITTTSSYEIKNSLVDFIFSAPQSWELKFDNCDILNGDSFDGGSVLGEATVIYKGCDLFPASHSGATPRLMYDCYAKAGGGSTAVNISGQFRRASGNSIQAGVTFTAGVRTPAEWVNGYYDSSYFEPV